MPYGVIFDTISIQQYVFSTNSLKENLGASYIIEEVVYGRILKDAVKKVIPDLNDSIFDEWKTNYQRVTIINGADFEIGYIGGGNAFLLFKEKSKAIEFIKEWSKMILVECPGINIISAVGEINFNDFKTELGNLFKKLSENKSFFIPDTILMRHGITADCRRTGYSREIWCDKLPENEKDYISSVSYAKIVAAEYANKKHYELLGEFQEEYTFTDDLEKLGQLKSKDNHIAIVFIDGNEMGQRFKEQTSLPDIRNLSITVGNATKTAFKKMLNKLIQSIRSMKESGDFIIETSNNKTILPVRPIIIGGDDITFVSDGRLGIWLAKVFIEALEAEKVSDKKPLTACAGISIIKTKYPFYRGYHLAESLTSNAKHKRKESKKGGSWIDFHLSYGGFSGTLEDIRRRQHRISEYELLMRPYILGDFEEILKCVKELKAKDEQGKLKFPNSKLKRLREVLTLGSVAVENFKTELKVRSLKLPVYKDFKFDTIVQNRETPYFDIIELVELYPEFAL